MMRNAKRILSAVLSATLIFGAGRIAINNDVKVNAAETYYSQCEEMLDLINLYRTQNGAAPLKLYINACDAASLRANEISTLFDHTRPNGSNCSTVLDEFGIKCYSMGENIAYGYPSVSSVMDGWMNSSGHRANILSADFDYVGIGIVDSRYWTQIFIGRDRGNRVKGDSNSDGSINAVDASSALQYYAYQSIAPYFEQTDAFIYSSDVNNDGTVNAVDCSAILRYYSMSSTGQSPTFN